MTPLARGFWIVSQVAALPLAVFCWFAALFWLAVAGYHGAEGSGGGLGWTWAEWRDVAAFGAFGPVFWIGLRLGPRVPPRWSWLPVALPIPWLGGFLAAQFDEEVSMPGDGMLPATLQGPPVTIYLAVLLALVATNLILAVADALGPGCRES